MEILYPLAGFAFVTSVTPGPNNILLLGSGLRFGFWQTLPHILGIQFGVALQLVLSAAGLGVLLVNYPGLQVALKIFGTSYLLHLAWQLRHNLVKEREDGQRTRPFTFVQGALFQFINPKAWMMTLTASSLFLPSLDSKLASIALLCLVFNSVGAPSSGSWAVLGSTIKHYLRDSFWQRCFSGCMIAITVFAALAIWFW
ncbi:MAG: LysE family translocator [Exilibacterium sp.]